MKKIIISGYYGFGNSGDEAILRTIIRDLKELDNDIDITVLSSNPELTKDKYHVKAVNRFNIINIIKNISRCDMLISGGGSLLQDVTSTRSLLYYLFIVKIALLFNKKVMLYANGIGPVLHGKNRLRIKSMINNVGYITLREEQSLRFLKQMGVNKPRIHLTADPVLNYEFSNDELVKKILSFEGIPTDAEYAAINIRDWKMWENFEMEVAKAADYLFDIYNIKSIFVPMSKNDIGVIDKVSGLMKNESYTLSKCYEPEDIIGILSKMKIVIAMRLHTLIYASINSIPMIGLAYDIKIEGYLEYIDQISVGDIKHLKSEQICKSIDKVFNDYESYREKLNIIIGELKKKAKENAKIAYGYLMSKVGE